jgi:hypothetical protein
MVHLAGTALHRLLAVSISDSRTCNVKYISRMQKAGEARVFPVLEGYCKGRNDVRRMGITSTRCLVGRRLPFRTSMRDRS